jgi:hypothetical protein
MKSDTKLLVAAGTVIAIVGVVLSTRRAQALPQENVLFSDLTAFPSVVYVNEPVSISLIAHNLSDRKGTANIIIGGDIMAEITVTLNPGESREVKFTFVPPDARQYVASVDGLTATFTAVEPPSANIVLSDLTVTPSDPLVGEEVTISVVATNIGNAVGSRLIDVTIT